MTERDKEENALVSEPYVRQANESELNENSREPGPPKKWWKKVLDTIILILLTCLLTIAGTNFYLTGRLPWDGILNDKQAIPAGQMRRLQGTYQTIVDSYVEEVDNNKLITGAIKGMTDAIEDPYSQYLEDEQAQSLNQTIDGSFEGIGAEVMQKDQKVQVVSPIKDSPAEKAGIKANDFILAVDGQSIEGKSAEEAVSLIRGESGKKVVLTIQRGDKTQDITVTRGEIPIQTVNATLVEGTTVGRIQITSFSTPTYDEVVDAVKDLRQQGAKSFVLDVRGNPGGLLPSALQIANMFLNDGDTIVQIQEKDKEAQKMAASDTDYGDFQVDEPTVILVDEGSASASEILAGALQQSANVKVVGTTTFGKGTVQSVIPVDKSAELKLTIAKWLTPDGTWINEKGIQPDVEVELPDYAQLTLIDSSETYAVGDHSKAIENIKKILNVLGYLDSEAINQDFDEQTAQAVSQLQQEASLETTGEIDADTAVEMVRQIQTKIAENDTQLDKAVETVQSE